MGFNTFYRVGIQDNTQGLWYNPEGEFTGLIHTKFDFCGASKLDYFVQQECTWEEEGQGLLQTIYEDGKFYNTVTLSQIRNRVNI